MTDPVIDPPAFVVFNEIGIIEHLSRTAAERVMPHGLSMAGFTVLNHMVRLGHAQRAPAQIASAVQVTRGAMTGTLRRLETEGWIEVTPDPMDGRGKVVRVTREGQAIRGAAIHALTPMMETMLEGMDLVELAAILPTLQKLRRILDAARD